MLPFMAFCIILKCSQLLQVAQQFRSGLVGIVQYLVEVGL